MRVSGHISFTKIWMGNICDRACGRPVRREAKVSAGQPKKATPWPNLRGQSTTLKSPAHLRAGFQEIRPTLNDRFVRRSGTSGLKIELGIYHSFNFKSFWRGCHCQKALNQSQDFFDALQLTGKAGVWPEMMAVRGEMQPPRRRCQRPREKMLPAYSAVRIVHNSGKALLPKVPRK